MPPKKKIKTEAASAKKKDDIEEKKKVVEETPAAANKEEGEKREKEPQQDVKKKSKPETAAARKKREAEEKKKAAEEKPAADKKEDGGKKKTKTETSPAKKKKVEEEKSPAKKEKGKQKKETNQDEKMKSKPETAAAKKKKAEEETAPAKKEEEEKKEKKVVEKEEKKTKTLTAATEKKKEAEKKKDEEETENDNVDKAEQKEEEENEEVDAGDEAKTDNGDDESRGKRKRKAITEAAFEPEDFTMAGVASSIVKIVEGRGTKLKEFPSVVASMEKRTHEEILFAHKFIFGNKGATLKKKELLANLHEFSGYLKKVPKGCDKKKLEAEDEREEERYSKKAFKLILAQVRSLCDIFNILKVDDQTGKTLNKEDTIDNLLDFLAQPNEDFLNPEGTTKSGPAKKAAKTTKKLAAKTTKKLTTTKMARKAKVEKKQHYFHLIKSHKFGEKPTEQTLRMWVRSFVHCLNMDKATTKDAIKYATQKFGYDMTDEKERLKELLAEELDPDLIA